jgi:hypothetical protein
MKAEDSDLRALFPNSYGYVASVRKKAARIRAAKVADSSIPIGASKLGGNPDLSAMLSWPMDGERPMSFLAQLRLEDVAPFDDDALVPHEGLLLFFASVAGGEAKGRVLRASAEAELVRTAPPKSAFDAPHYDACTIELASIPSFPRAPSPFVDVDAISKKERAGYDDIVRALDDDLGATRAPKHQLFGYAAAPDESLVQDGDTRLVLQLDRDPVVGFERAVAFFGQDADLRRGDVGKARVRLIA